MKHIAVVICSHSRQAELLHTLSHLNEHSSINFHGVRSQMILVFDGDEVTTAYRIAVEALNWGEVPPIIVTTEHIGQNAGRNLGLKLAIEAGHDYALLLDDDAVLHPQTAIEDVIGLFDQQPRAGAIGLTVIVEATGEDQYYSGSPDQDVFPVVIACLAATVLDLRIAASHREFFFPKEIRYGSDEWALGIRVRDVGKQVFATRRGHAIHRHVQGGRTSDIRYRYQYAHGFVFGILPGCTGLVLMLSRVCSILRRPLFEPKYLMSRLRGVVWGWLCGFTQKNAIKQAYGLEVSANKINPLLAESFQIEHPLFSRLLRLL